MKEADENIARRIKLSLDESGPRALEAAIKSDTSREILRAKEALQDDNL
jgi:hypothetical protein